MALGKADGFREQLAYGGNPEHKKRPNDYGLTPPMNPRPGKTLCDAFGPLPKREALLPLKNGAMKGMMSERLNGEVPQNIWTVSDQGLVYEAQVENAAQCTYHGYPMPSDDDFRAVILALPGHFRVEGRPEPVPAMRAPDRCDGVREQPCHDRATHGG